MTVDNPASAAPWRPLVQIGDISVDQDWVRTPSGSVPTAQVTWTAQDLTRRDLAIPTYAIVLALVFALFCLLGLLFLLVKEERTSGWIQVTAQTPSFVHTTYLPVFSPETFADGYARVSYARTLTGAAQRKAV